MSEPWPDLEALNALAAGELRRLTGNQRPAPLWPEGRPRGHGPSPRPPVRSGLVPLGAGVLLGRCRVLKVRRQEDRFTAQVEVDAVESPGQPRGIWDVCLGQGGSAEEAVRGAVRIWVETELPPLRQALSPEPVEYTRMLQQPDTRAGLTRGWYVFEGPFFCMGDDHAPLLERLRAEPPFARVARQGALPRLGPGQPVHWLKLFLARRTNGAVQGECRLDSAPCPSVLSALAAFQWPEGSGFLSFRQFVVLRRWTDETG